MAIVMYILVLALGMPVLFWSKYLWLPILGRKDRKAVSLGMSSVAVFGVMVSVYQGMNGDVTQTPAALSAHLAYAEHYTGPWLYQGLGMAALMVLAISMFIYKPRSAGEAPNQLRFWAAGLLPGTDWHYVLHGRLVYPGYVPPCERLALPIALGWRQALIGARP